MTTKNSDYKSFLKTAWGNTLSVKDHIVSRWAHVFHKESTLQNEF